MSKYSLSHLAAGILTSAYCLLCTSAIAGTLSPLAVCNPTKVRYLSNNALQQTTSNSYVNVKGMTAKFVQGNSSSCVVVTFTIAGATETGTLLWVEPRFDGTPVGFYETQWLYSSVFFQSRAVHFVFNNVNPGSHTIKMTYRSTLSGKQVSLAEANMIVRYAQ